MVELVEWRGRRSARPTPQARQPQEAAPAPALPYSAPWRARPRLPGLRRRRRRPRRYWRLVGQGGRSEERGRRRERWWRRGGGAVGRRVKGLAAVRRHAHGGDPRGHIAQRVVHAAASESPGGVRFDATAFGSARSNPNPNPKHNHKPKVSCVTLTTAPTTPRTLRLGTTST